MTIRAFSFGGGVQSTAALVLAAQGRIDFPLFLFSNVGADSENAQTLEYVRDHSRPYAERHGLEFVELHKVRRDGTNETLLGRVRRAEHSVPIPMRMSNGAPGNRKCTGDFKIRVIAKELKRRGATPADPAVVGLGISLDEWKRARNDSGVAYEQLEYPLLDMRLTRRDCLQIVALAGLPEPPKSACWFCPYQSIESWRRMRRENPKQFEAAADLEQSMIERRERMGKDAVYLTSKGRPITDVVADQLAFDLDDNCDSGYCWV